MLKILGKLKGITAKAKVLDDGEDLYMIELKLELLEGEHKIQEVMEHLKTIVELEIVSKQPTLNEQKKK